MNQTPVIEVLRENDMRDSTPGVTGSLTTTPARVIAARHAPLASAIYEGWVRHRRFAPHPHAFRYRVCMLYLDLAELDCLFAKRWLWSQGRRNVAEFRRSDYFGDVGTSLEEAVRNRIASETGRMPRGPIRLLTHLRYCGVSFNPVSFYYCYAEDGVTLETILAEITNTPWRERYAYVLPVSQAARHGVALRWDFDKTFHVSPFVPMQRRYAWRFTIPAEMLRIQMDVLRRSEPAAELALHDTNEQAQTSALELDATLVLQRRALNGANLARVLIRYPLMTAQIVAAIHWQALRIWLRGNPVHDHPKHQEHSG